MKPVPTAWAFSFDCGRPLPSGRPGWFGCIGWPKRSAKRFMNSSICFCCESDVRVSSSSSVPAFMVTATLTTAGVTLAARSEKS